MVSSSSRYVTVVFMSFVGSHCFDFQAPTSFSCGLLSSHKQLRCGLLGVHNNRVGSHDYKLWEPTFPGCGLLFSFLWAPTLFCGGYLLLILFGFQKSAQTIPIRLAHLLSSLPDRPILWRVRGLTFHRLAGLKHKRSHRVSISLWACHLSAHKCELRPHP